MARLPKGKPSTTASINTTSPSAKRDESPSHANKANLKDPSSPDSTKSQLLLDDDDNKSNSDNEIKLYNSHDTNRKEDISSDLKDPTEILNAGVTQSSEHGSVNDNTSDTDTESKNDKTDVDGNNSQIKFFFPIVLIIGTAHIANPLQTTNIK